MKKQQQIELAGRTMILAEEYRGFKIVREVKGRVHVAYGTTDKATGFFNIGPTVKACKENLDGYAKAGWIPGQA